MWVGLNLCVLGQRPKNKRGLWDHPSHSDRCSLLFYTQGEIRQHGLTPASYSSVTSISVSPSHSKV